MRVASFCVVSRDMSCVVVWYVVVWYVVVWWCRAGFVPWPVLCLCAVCCPVWWHVVVWWYCVWWCVGCGVWREGVAYVAMLMCVV